MALMGLTGAESGSLLEGIASAGTISVGTPPSGFGSGSYCYRTNPTTTGTGRIRVGNVAASGSFNSSYSAATIYARFKFRVDTLPAANDEPIFTALTTGAAQKLEIRINSSGQLVAYNSVGTLLSTGSTSLSTTTEYLLEVKCGTSATVGAWEVKINGTSEISGTANTSATNNGSVYLGKSLDRNSQTVDFYYDDLLISDSAYPGTGSGLLLVPNANGNYQTWTIGAGGGSHYTNVDEVPHNSNTDYLLSTQVVGDAETEALTDCSTAGISGTINGVLAMIIVVRNAVGSAIFLRLRSASTDNDNASASGPGASYVLFGQMRDTDPATSAAWTTSGVDGVEVGAKENTTTAATRMTAAWLYVDFVPAAASGAGPIFGGRAIGKGRIFGGSALIC